MKKFISLLFLLVFLSPLFAERATLVKQSGKVTIKWIWNTQYCNGPNNPDEFTNQQLNIYDHADSVLEYIYFIDPKMSARKNITYASIVLDTVTYSYGQVYYLSVYQTEDGLFQRIGSFEFYNYTQAMNEFQDFVNIFEKSVSY